MFKRPEFGSWLCGSAILLAALLASPAQAAPKPEHIKQGKSAVALLVVPGRGFATGFCIDDRGYFITNEHAVRGVKPDEKVTLVLNPNETDQNVIEALVVRTDKDMDLALLHVQGLKSPVTLELGDTKNLIETAEIVAFGYPFGTALAVKKKDYPNISVNVGRITALRKSEGKLEMIQTDAALNPGNSGGPALDDDGKVIGVVSAGIRNARGGNAGVNFLIPVDEVHAFLAQPQIVFTAPTVPFEKRQDDLKLQAQINTFSKREQAFDVTLELVGNDAKRVIKAKRDKDQYILRFKPIEPSDAVVSLPVELQFTSGSVRGQLADMKVAVGDVKPSLSDISRLQRTEGDAWKIHFKDGKQTEGQIKLGKVQVELGGTSVTIDTAKVTGIVIYEPPAPPSEVSYTLTVTREGKAVATQTGRIAIGPPPAKVVTSVGQTPGLPGTRGYEPPKGEASFEGQRVKIKLSERFNSFTIAGAGRYFAFHLKEEAKVVILDVLAGKVVHEIPGMPTDVLIAGGRESLVLVFPGQKLMQRWRLDPFEREKTAPMPAKGTARRAILGQDSRGPLLVVGEDAVFVDLDTMQPMKVEGEILGAMYGSAQGGTYTDAAYWNYLRMKLDGPRTIVDKFGMGQGEAGRWARLTADGSLLWSKGPNIYNATGKRLETKWLEGCTVYATVDPRFFIAVKFAQDEQRKRAVTHMHICTTADRRIVHTIVGMEEMAPSGNTNQYNNTVYRLWGGEERFHYVPWANLIVTLAWDSDIITLEKFNLIAAQEQSGVDYLFVTSIPPVKAYRGQTFAHEMAVTSKAGDVKYTLESGPKGMTLSPAGALRWDVPSHTAETSANVIIRVNDRAGSELFHAFELVVEDAPATIIEGKAQP